MTRNTSKVENKNWKEKPKRVLSISKLMEKKKRDSQRARESCC